MNKHDFKNQQKLLAAYEVSKDYQTPGGRLPVLKRVDFSLYSGDMVFIIGRSGSGKSTLMHMLGGLDFPTSGKIVFEGDDLTQLSEKALAKIRNRRIGFVFQFYHLLPELTVYENVMLPMMIQGKRDEAWVKEILKRVKLLSRKEHYPSELSGGEQQRVAIARALVNRPAVVLCDEPTGNLDQETAESVMSLLNELNRQEGQSFVVVTHDEGIAWRYDRVYRLVDGVLSPAKPGQVELQHA